jgi:hypothetical protein
VARLAPCRHASTSILGAHIKASLPIPGVGTRPRRPRSAWR